MIGDYLYVDGGEVSQLYNGKNYSDPLHPSFAGADFPFSPVPLQSELSRDGLC